MASKARDYAVSLKNALKDLHAGFPPLPPFPLGQEQRSDRERMILDLLEQHMQKVIDGESTDGAAAEVS